MSRTKEIGTAVGTLACALGIGFAMQSTETANERYGDVRVAFETMPEKPVSEVAAAPVDTTLINHASVGSEDVLDVMEVNAITYTSALVDVPEVIEAARTYIDFGDALTLEGWIDPIDPTDLAVTNAPENCDILAYAIAKPNAFVELNVQAPCHAQQTMTVDHNGTFFSAQLDAQGSMSLTVPALAASAVYIMSFESGEGAVAHARIEDFAETDRVLLQWQGSHGFEMHVRANGAQYGEDGHLWHGAQTENSAHGSLIRLEGSAENGDVVTEVFTFPKGARSHGGNFDVTVEVQVTESNCSTQTSAETTQVSDLVGVQSRKLTMAVPPCDAIGNYLVLNNILNDMKLAAR